MTHLRTRIAAVLVMHREDDVGELDCICGWEWAGYGLYADAYANHLADAVIRELKLEAEDGECGYCQAQLPGCRYSTWVDDE